MIVAFPKGLVPEPTPILNRRWTFPGSPGIDPSEVGLTLASLIAALVGR